MNGYNNLNMAIWNCNGMLWFYLGGFSETYVDRYLMFYPERHESIERGLPILKGYTWESTHKKEMQRNINTQGFGGAVVLFKTQLRPHIYVMQIEEHAWHMWIRIRLLDARPIFIIICYFPLDTSSYAHEVTTKGQPPPPHGM